MEDSITGITTTVPFRLLCTGPSPGWATGPEVKDWALAFPYDAISAANACTRWWACDQVKVSVNPAGSSSQSMNVKAGA